MKEARQDVFANHPPEFHQSLFPRSIFEKPPIVRSVIHINEPVSVVITTRSNNHRFTCPGCQRENIYLPNACIPGCKFCLAPVTPA